MPLRATLLALAVAFARGPLLAADAEPQPEVEVMHLDFDTAVQLDLPYPGKVGEHQHFTTPDGKKGWVARIADDARRLMTPAYGDEMVFASGRIQQRPWMRGFDAASGRQLWEQKLEPLETPHAPVHVDGKLVFAGTFGTLRALEARTGTEVWREELVKFSQTKNFVAMQTDPAIADGCVYFNHPVRGKDAAFNLVCLDLETGNERWRVKTASEAISAPVVAGDRIYLTFANGSIHCLHAPTGRRYWVRKWGCCSAPLAVGNEVFAAVLHRGGDRKHAILEEGIERFETKSGKSIGRSSPRDAGYLHAERVRAALEALVASLRDDPGLPGHDNNHGVATRLVETDRVWFVQWFPAFTTKKPGAAKTTNNAAWYSGMRNLSSVGFEGSHPVSMGPRILTRQGKALTAIDVDGGGLAWRLEAKGAGAVDDMPILTAPALGRAKLYVGSMAGHIAIASQATGEVETIYSLGHPIFQQPVLGHGRIYVTTSSGLLVCLDLEDDDADDWPTWAGHASRNPVRD